MLNAELIPTVRAVRGAYGPRVRADDPRALRYPIGSQVTLGEHRYNVAGYAADEREGVAGLWLCRGVLGSAAILYPVEEVEPENPPCLIPKLTRSQKALLFWLSPFCPLHVGNRGAMANVLTSLGLAVRERTSVYRLTRDGAIVQKHYELKRAAGRLPTRKEKVQP